MGLYSELASESDTFRLDYIKCEGVHGQILSRLKRYREAAVAFHHAITLLLEPHNTSATGYAILLLRLEEEYRHVISRPRVPVDEELYEHLVLAISLGLEEASRLMGKQDQ